MSSPADRPRPSGPNSAIAADTTAVTRASLAWPELAVAGLVAAAVSLAPFHRGLAFPFALDDYTYLFRAADLDSGPFSLRRWLAVRGYYEAALKIFGPHPLPWHIVAFALHAANSAWVLLLARRLGASRGASWIASMLFAASPLAFTVLYWIACIQELGSCFFVLAAVWMALRTGRSRWLSVPLFAVAMLFKESVLAMPLALVLLLGRPGGKLALLQLGIGVALFLASGLGSRMWVSDPASPYATAYDQTVLLNLVTQLVWFLAPWRSYPDRLAGPQPDLLLPGLIVIAGGLTLFAATRWHHGRALLQACVWYVALLLPVLPLQSHAYAYYSYTPQIGFLILAGAVLDRLGTKLLGAWRRAVRDSQAGAPRTAGKAPPPKLAASALAGLRFLPGATVILLWAACAGRNAITHETLTLKNSTIPHDSVVRYARAAGAIVQEVQAAKLPPQVKRVTLMSLPSSLGSGAPAPGMENAKFVGVRTRTFPLQSAMRNGKLIALHFPHLEGAWVDSLTPREESAETAILFGSGFNKVEKLEDVAEAYNIQAQGHIMTGNIAAAEHDLRRALELRPRHTVARLMLAGVLIEEKKLDEIGDLVRDLRPGNLPPQLHPMLEQVQDAARVLEASRRSQPVSR